jgi:polar amino acid transport system substrate-binding protein
MMMVKKMVFLFLTCSLFFGQTVHARNITLGYVDFPPYEFENNGKASGVLVEIIETLFKKANISVELKFLPFKRAYETTKKGGIDGLFNFYKTEERLNFFDYTEPIIKNPLVFFVRKDSKIRYNKLEDLRGLKVGILRGYTYGTSFDKSRLFIQEATNSHESNFRKLMLGRINVYPCDKLVGIHVAMENKLMPELKILSTPLKVMDGYIGFTKGKHKDIIPRINKLIIEMHQSGEIEAMINKYMEKYL